MPGLGIDRSNDGVPSVCSNHYTTAPLGVNVKHTNPACATSLRNFGEILYTLLCQCLSEVTLKAVGPFYQVSMPGEVLDPTQPSRVNV